MRASVIFALVLVLVDVLGAAVIVTAPPHFARTDVSAATAVQQAAIPPRSAREQKDLDELLRRLENLGAGTRSDRDLTPNPSTPASRPIRPDTRRALGALALLVAIQGSLLLYLHRRRRIPEKTPLTARTDAPRPPSTRTAPRPRVRPSTTDVVPAPRSVPSDPILDGDDWGEANQTSLPTARAGVPAIAVVLVVVGGLISLLIFLSAVAP
jgi:hypothetical protein